MVEFESGQQAIANTSRNLACVFKSGLNLSVSPFHILQKADKGYSQDNYAGVAIVHFEDLQLKRASLWSFFIFSSPWPCQCPLQLSLERRYFLQHEKVENIRAIYKISLCSGRSEVTGERKNGAREGKGKRFSSASLACALPSLVCLPRAPRSFLHPSLPSAWYAGYNYTDKTADHIPSCSAHKPDTQIDTQSFLRTLSKRR